MPLDIEQGPLQTVGSATLAFVHGSTAIVSVSFNTKELTAMLLWSIHRILEPDSWRILIVDNASTDGSAEVLERAQDAELCQVIFNKTNVGHGPGLNLAMRSQLVNDAARAWILDSDCVITRPDALREPLQAHPDAAIIGEPHWDQWRNRDRFELYSLIIDPAAVRRPGSLPFTDDGDPAWELLTSAEQAGLTAAPFPFAADGYLIHVGRASLAAVAAANDTSHPLYSWAIEHHEPHFGGLEGTADRHAEIFQQFKDEVGPDLDLAASFKTG